MQGYLININTKNATERAVTTNGSTWINALDISVPDDEDDKKETCRYDLISNWQLYSK